MMKSLTFASNAAYTFALLLVVSVNIKAKPIRYILCALVLLSKPLFLQMTLPVWHIFIDMTACTVCVYDKNNDFCSLAFNAIYSVFLFILVLGVSSSIIALILPSWHRSMSYEIFIIFLLPIVGILYRVNKAQHKHRKQPKVVMIASMILEILVISAYLAISQIFHELDLTQFSLLVLLVIAILIIAIALMRFISKKEAETRILSLKAEQNEEIQRIYKRVIEFEHLHSDFTQVAYRLLLHHEYQELENLFKNQIKPLIESTVFEQELQKIDNLILREQILIAVNNAAMMQNVAVHVHVFSPISLERDHIAPVSKLISEFFNNALESLKKQQDGMLNVELIQIDQVCSITVSNSIEENDNDFQRVVSNPSLQDSGNGRSLIFQTAKTTPYLKHFETIETNPLTGMQHFTQTIILNDIEG